MNEAVGRLICQRNIAAVLLSFTTKKDAWRESSGFSMPQERRHSVCRSQVFWLGFARGCEMNSCLFNTLALLCLQDLLFLELRLSETNLLFWPPANLHKTSRAALPVQASRASFSLKPSGETATDKPENRLFQMPALLQNIRNSAGFSCLFP